MTVIVFMPDAANKSSEKGNAMEIEYNLTIKDLSALARPLQEKKTRVSSARRSAAAAQWPWFVILSLIMVAWMVVNYPGRDRAFKGLTGFVAPFLMGMPLGAIGLGCVLVVMKKILLVDNNRFRDDPRNRWLFGPHRIQIEPERVTLISSVQQLQIAWAGICQIDATDNLIAFWTTTRSTHVVPRRAFRDQQHFEEFVALARQYQQGRGQQAPKPTGIIAGLPPQLGAFTRPDAS